MANIKDLKKKIKATKGTLKITSAMKLVAASKFAKAGQAIHHARAYSGEIENSVKAVCACLKIMNTVILKIPRGKRPFY